MVKPLHNCFNRCCSSHLVSNYSLYLLTEGPDLFSFLDASAAKAFGTEMARSYIERMPPNAALTEKQFTSKSKHTIEKMSVQIAAHKQQNKLNLYKIAQMANAFKWTLKDAGYADDYIDKLTQWFVVRVKL